MSRQILLIEDDEASQYIFGTILQVNGYEILRAWSASEGLQMAREHKPDLVVLDIGLPEMNGFEVARQLKADPETREIRVLAVTVHVFDREREQALEAGCDYFLGKPVEPNVLAREVNRILKAAEPQVSSEAP